MYAIIFRTLAKPSQDAFDLTIGFGVVALSKICARQIAMIHSDCGRIHIYDDRGKVAQNDRRPILIYHAFEQRM
jgi:hypothetical protein